MNRLALVLHGLAHGGNEALCYSLARHWSGIEKVLINLDPTKQQMRRQFLAVPRLRIIDVPYTPRDKLGFVERLAATFRTSAPDAAAIFNFGLHVLVAAAARQAGVRYMSGHAGNPPPTAPGPRSTWRSLVVASSAVGVSLVSCSEYVDSALRDLGAPMPARARAVSNGVDVEALAARADAARRQRGSGPAVIGMVARLNAIKDHRTLIQAFARLSHKRAELWIAGDGELRVELEALAAAGSARVRFLGPRADVPELLGQVDLYAFATTPAEGFGIALIEAMSAGLPIVATDVPACREVLAGTPARLVPMGDVSALADALESMLQNRSQWESEGAAMRAHARARFDISQCAKGWESVLGAEP